MDLSKPIIKKRNKCKFKSINGEQKMDYFPCDNHNLYINLLPTKVNQDQYFDLFDADDNERFREARRQ